MIRMSLCLGDSPVSYQQGRHEPFFSWHGQDYFAYCDILQSGNRYFRDTFISYVHYRADGSIASSRVDLTGVGEYDAQSGVIEAEEFFANSGFVAFPDSGLRELTYPNIHGLGGSDTLVSDMTGKATLSLPCR